MAHDIHAPPEGASRRFVRTSDLWRVILLLALAGGAYAAVRWTAGLSGTRGPLSVARLLALFIAAVALYQLVVLLIKVLVHRQRGSAGEVTMLIGFVRVIAAVGVVFALLGATGRLQELGAIIGAFAGLLLGWSLQAPVSGIAAWVLVSLKRPFRVGDRVQFASLGLLGDILDIGLMYTRLNQVGGAVGSEEAIGRSILIPNAMLFSQVAINYTPQVQAPYFLDEVIVRLTYDSDWDEAERILLRAARQVTDTIIRQTGKEPYIRSDNYDYGVYMRLRYMTVATDRPRIAHEILKLIFHEFQHNANVDFAIPYVYSYRRGADGPRRATNGTPPERTDAAPVARALEVNS